MWVETKPVGVFGGTEKHLQLLDNLRKQRKLCCKYIYEVETEFKQEKQVYIYKTKVITYLAEICPYLGSYQLPGNNDETPYCAARENPDMNPQICMKIWKNNIPYHLMKVTEVKSKTEKVRKDGLVFYRGRWWRKEDLEYRQKKGWI